LLVKEVERLDTLKSRERCAAYGHAFRANAAVKSLLDRCADGSEVNTLIQEGFLDAGCGVLDITKADIEWMHVGGRGETYTIDDLDTCQDMFIRTEVSEEESMRVGRIPLLTRFSDGIKVGETRAAIGIFDFRQTTDEWAGTVIDRLLDYRVLGLMPGAQEVFKILRENPEHVSDDPILIEAVRQDTAGQPVQTVLLFSADIKNCRAVARITGNHVIAVHPDVLIQLVQRDGWTGSVSFTQTERDMLCDLFKPDNTIPAPQLIYVDTGSMMKVAMNYVHREVAGHKTKTLAKITGLQAYRSSVGRTVVYEENLVTRSSLYPGRIISANRQERNFTFGVRGAPGTPALERRSVRLTRTLATGKNVLSTLSKSFSWAKPKDPDGNTSGSGTWRRKKPPAGQ
jgi:hypothetical protein